MLLQYTLILFFMQINDKHVDGVWIRICMLRAQTSHIIDVFRLHWLTAQPSNEVTAAVEGGQIVFLHLTTIM
jgi:hypothetical protein